MSLAWVVLLILIAVFVFWVTQVAGLPLLIGVILVAIVVLVGLKYPQDIHL